MVMVYNKEWIHKINSEKFIGVQNRKYQIQNFFSPRPVKSGHISFFVSIHKTYGVLSTREAQSSHGVQSFYWDTSYISKIDSLIAHVADLILQVN